MSKPGKYPWNDENQEFRGLKTLENRLKLLILGHYKIEDDFTQDNADVANIKLEKVVKVYFTSFFHHVVADVISKDCKKYWSNVMKALNVPEFWMMTKEVIKDHEYVVLAFFST